LIISTLFFLGIEALMQVTGYNSALRGVYQNC